MSELIGMGGEHTAATAVAEKLRTKIIRGDIPAGERLRQDAIATEFGVSQTIAREAFKKLEGEGLIDIEPRRGARVAEMSATSVKEITALRCRLEPLALEWSIPNMTDGDFQVAEKILRKLDKATKAADLIGLNATFHEVLYAPSRAGRTLSLISELRLAFERYLRVAWKETPYHSKSQNDHWTLLELCREKKNKKACSLLQSHIKSTGTLLLEKMEEKGMLD